MVEESEFCAANAARNQDQPQQLYRWYQAYEVRGLERPESQSREVRQHWNRIPEPVRAFSVEVALEHPDLTPRELAWHITDTRGYYVTESRVYRILKAHDLITSLQFMVMSAYDAFQSPSSRVHELWQTDFTYLRVVGLNWYFLSTVLDEYSRSIISWRLTTTIAASDVPETLEDALNSLVCQRLGSDTGRAFCLTILPVTPAVN